MARRAIVGVGVALAVTAPGLAHAVCGAPPPMSVSVRRNLVVPLNPRPALTAPASWRGGRPLVLATAPRAGQPAVRVETRVRAWTSTDHERLELTPATELSPATTYELQSSAGEILAVFTTGMKADTTPPAWAGLASGSLWRPQPGKTLRIAEECGEDLVMLESPSAAADDQTPSSDLRYALWAGPPRSPLDYKSPPLTWIRIDDEEQKRTTPAPRGTPRFRLSFGSTDTEAMDFALPAMRPLKVGIKVIDLAGNESPASELTLN